MAARTNYPDVSAADGTGSTSTISAETAIGWHVLKIEGYSQTKGVLGVGNGAMSGAFSVGGHSWCVRYYPDGCNEDFADWICFDLLFLGDDLDDAAAVKVKYSITLLDKAGQAVPPYTTTSDVCTLSSTTPSSGFHNLIKRAELEPSSSSYLGDDDSFSVRCVVTVVKAIRAKSTTATTKSQTPALAPELLTKKPYGAHQLAPTGTVDVSIEVGSKWYGAHRTMLAARSSVFMAMLFGPAADDDGVVHLRIDNMEARVFEALLHFIYTDELPIIDEGDKAEMAQRLLAAADRYNLQELKLICWNVLQGNIDGRTVVNTLVLAEQHGCHGLKEECFRFLVNPSNHRASLEHLCNIERLARIYPTLLKELIEFIAER